MVKTYKKPVVKQQATKTPLAKSPPKLPNQPIDLFKKSLCVDVDFSKPGNTRKVGLGQVDLHFSEHEAKKIKEAAEKVKKQKGEEEVDKSLFKLQKSLLDSPELEAVNTFDQQVRMYLYSMALPSPLKRGVYLIPVALIPKVREELDKKIHERQLLVNAFMDMYPARIEEIRNRLGPAFDQANYPSVQTMRNKFRMSYQIFSMGVPQNMQTLDGAILEEESKKLQSSMKDLYLEIANTLRAGFKGTVDKIVKSLSPTQDGKRGRIYEANVEALLNFIETFSAKNIVDDKDCELLVEQAKSLLKGKDAKYIAYSARTNDDFREHMLDAFSKIGEKAEALVVMDESRDITL